MDLYFVFIVSAIFSWAISAPLIQKGMRSVDSGFKIMMALLVSFGVGYFLLFFSTGSIGILPLEQALFSFAAGLLTFPLGTGVYYFTIGRISAKNMMPFLYLKLPLVLFLSYVLLGEGLALNHGIILGMALLVAGLYMSSLSIRRKAAGREEGGRMRTVMFAVSIPVFWALGEITMKMGTEGIAPIRAIFYSLSFGFFTTIGLVLIYSLLKKRRWERKDYFPRRSYLYFAGHGFLSIFIAYTLYFWAIGLGSVSLSSLLVAVWPILAVFIGILIERIQKIPFAGNPRYLICGSVLCFASQLAILLAS